VNRRHLSWLLGALLTALLAVPATWLLFTQFMFYDDEGYVLWSLKNYTELGSLYTKVYSQYGPAFFTAYDALHRLTGFPFTNESGRWITLGFWCGTAWVAGAITAALTQNLMARLAAIALTFAALFSMCSEPIHPGGPLAFLSIVAAWCGSAAILRGRPRLLALACGALGAVMVLTKINVGVFLFIASGSWLVLHGPLSASARRLVGWFVLLGCFASPLALMQAKLDDPRYAGFALVFACSSATVALLLRRTARTEHTTRDFVAFAGAALVVTTLVILAVLARGTTWADLVHGVAVAPFKQTAAFAMPPQSTPQTIYLAVAALASAVWLVSRPVLSPRIIRIIAALRLLAAVGIALIGFAAVENSISRALFYLASPLAWLFAWPLREGNSGAARARLWLAWVFVWQTLHAFPVAGSQVAWGSLLGAPLLIVGMSEAIGVLWPTRLRLARGAHAFVLAAALVPCVVLARTGWFYRTVSTPLDLPGARRLTLPPNITQALRALDRNIRWHGGLLFSQPGMFSFNLWSGHPTPTAANVTVWSTLLSEQQQREIQIRLAADPRAVIITQQYVLGLLIAQGFPPRGELNTYVVENFAPAFRIDTYVFWTRRGRAIAPVGTAHRDALANGGWQLELITDAVGHAATWELWTNGAPIRLGHGSLGEAQATIEPIQPDGTAIGPARPLGNGALPGQLCRVRFVLPQLRLPSVDDLELRLLAPDGSTLESAPFRR
jgi:hypothetical protein